VVSQLVSRAGRFQELLRQLVSDLLVNRLDKRSSSAALRAALSSNGLTGDSPTDWKLAGNPFVNRLKNYWKTAGNLLETCWKTGAH
jgi:hypothetical protein